MQLDMRHKKLDQGQSTTMPNRPVKKQVRKERHGVYGWTYFVRHLGRWLSRLGELRGLMGGSLVPNFVSFIGKGMNSYFSDFDEV